MIIYLLKSSACLALLLLFYHLVLEKEKMHKFNRFYLLGSVLFSFLAPLYVIYTEVTPIITEATNNSTEFVFISEAIPMVIIEETSLNYSLIGIAIYILISFIFLFRFGKNLFHILQKTRKNTRIKYNKAIIVLVEDKILPHTFWNYIFINKEDYETENVEKELFTHELTHVTQKHTLDVIILELLQVIFWINPLFIILKKAVQLNHEFLADETVINKHKNTSQYQHLLLNKAAWKNEYYLASNLNYSLTKKRLKMMTTQSSQSKILLKKLAVIPLLVGFLFLFAERVEAQEVIEEKEEPIETIYEQPNNQKKLTESEVYKEYVYRNLTIQRKDKNGKYVIKKYNELNDEEKSRLVPPPPLKLKKIIPTKAQFEALKEKSKYAVWVNGKVVDNTVLDNYKYTDFARYSNSHVYQNARSKRFPQENQAHLETKKYFNSQNQKRVNRYLEYLKEKYNIKEIEEEVAPKVIEIKEQKKKYNLPSSNGSKQSTKANAIEIIDIREKLKDINKLELNFLGKGSSLYNYNFLANKYNQIPIEKRIIKLRDLNKLESLYKKLSKEEKISAEPFPECYLPNKKVLKEDPKFNKDWYITIDGQKYYYTFDRKERIARYYKNGKLANLDIVKEYNKKHKIFENLKKEGKHYIFKVTKAQKVIDREFSDLGGMYFRMQRADKNKVKRPDNPIKPYVKLRKGDKVWFKKRSELTAEDKLLLPPPPPIPNASKKEKDVALKAYKEWRERVGFNPKNKIPPPPKNK